MIHGKTLSNSTCSLHERFRIIYNEKYSSFLTVCSYHVTYAFQSESTLYSCLSINELLVRNRGDIWSSMWLPRDSNPHHLVFKGTLNHLAQLAKWWSCVVSTYLYSEFGSMFLSSHVHISEWIHTLSLTKRQGTPFLKQARYLKFKWLQRDSNLQPLSL